eukprot:TRINITY_DN7320_c0_g4_i2.p2 TRINITY_DN7320_c0_g4~~TRINITY_DN7320_c0_g4_i2.p2  ORF type:complete len:157 (+),score=28.70 TRINITY_DN7320_c0_g4_i2:23-493(+)
MAVPIMNEENFVHILRVLNTNISGREKVPIALTSIRGVGRRFSTICLKKAGIELTKRAGELSNEEVDRAVAVMMGPRNFEVPTWFLNRRRDIKDGKTTQAISNQLDTKLREDMELLRKIRSHRGIRHMMGLRVRGQHTKTTGRQGKTVGVSKKKGG